MNTEDTISKIIQYLKSRFAEKYNKLKNRIGPFWNERFKSSIVEMIKNPGEYLLQLLWALGGVSNKTEKNESSIMNHYTCLASYLDDNYVPPIAISLHDYFQQLGNFFNERTRHFRLLAATKQFPHL